MTPKTNKIGVTGGIASGKSLVCKIFAQLGVPIYNADERAKWLVSNHSFLIEQIKKHFGDESYTATNSYNRTFIANLVFKYPDKLSTLNNLVHPLVAEDFSAWVHKHEGASYVIKEAAIIFESGSNKSLDKVINVAAPVELRISRAILRDPFRKKEELEGIIRKQISEKERATLSDYTIINDGSKLVIPQVLKLHRQFLHI